MQDEDEVEEVPLIRTVPLVHQAFELLEFDK